MKEIYFKPDMSMMCMEEDQALLIGSKVFIDDPQDPVSALSREWENPNRFDLWTDEGEEDDDNPW